MSNSLITLGSSPLTRGKLQTAWEGIKTGGLIPAHAGKTLTRPRSSRLTEAHPRSRGENEAGDEKGSTFEGSSPLTRGKPAIVALSAAHAGLIPAHAGKTHEVAEADKAWGAHPRSRGENVRRRFGALLRPGSSPLTRGKPLLPTAPKAPPGLIPAHAGKTGWFRSWSRSRWAHPRSRGENGAGDRACLTSLGSSPLTRGKRWYVRPCPSTAGLIPAHAGKTLRPDGVPGGLEAHPRSRGENPGQMGAGIVGAGSSPLTRGKPLMPWQRQVADGLIPAHAGKT